MTSAVSRVILPDADGGRRDPRMATLAAHGITVAKARPWLSLMTRVSDEHPSAAGWVHSFDAISGVEVVACIRLGLTADTYRSALTAGIDDNTLVADGVPEQQAGDPTVAVLQADGSLVVCADTEGRDYSPIFNAGRLRLGPSSFGADAVAPVQRVVLMSLLAAGMPVGLAVEWMTVFNRAYVAPDGVIPEEIPSGVPEDLQAFNSRTLDRKFATASHPAALWLRLPGGTSGRRRVPAARLPASVRPYLAYGTSRLGPDAHVAGVSPAELTRLAASLSQDQVEDRLRVLRALAG